MQMPCVSYDRPVPLDATPLYCVKPTQAEAGIMKASVKDFCIRIFKVPKNLHGVTPIKGVQ